MSPPSHSNRRGAERREAERRTCPHAPLLRFLPKDSFQPLQGQIKDVSIKGIGLVCEDAFSVGTLLAIQWHYGAFEEWKTVLAYVVRVSPEPGGGTLVGCQFVDALSTAEVDALLATRNTDTPTGIRRAVLSLDFLSRLNMRPGS
jgi:hypothetical protein